MMRLSALLASIAAILAATLLPWSNFVGHAHWAQVQWLPFYGQQLDWVDIAGNVALFLPFGYFAARFRSAPGQNQGTLWVLVSATLLSTFAEIVQVYSHGRYPSTLDIGCNVFGAALGLMLSARRLSATQRERQAVGELSWRKSREPIDAPNDIR